MKFLFTLWICLLIITSAAHAQEHGFKFGEVTYSELGIKSYPRDTSASAVVLNEFGEAYFDSDNNYNLLFIYHVKIKILKKDGLSQADIQIPLRKSSMSGKEETIRKITASAFTIVNGSMREFKVEPKNIFSENKNKYWNIKKFAIPNVQVGSVIEYEYILESPFIQNFKSWEFQSEIPKIQSEYWPKIPANYVYSISLKGFQELSKKEDELVRDCFSVTGNGKADCILYKFAMKDIPAFKEEDYMTAKSNFVSTINFELSEIKFFDGRVDKITKEWKDAEQELAQEEKFGIQIKRGKNILDDHVDIISGSEIDPLVKAQKIYDFIKFWYLWDGVYWMYSEYGIKKAFDKKEGNAGDINLSLIAALKYAGFNVEPMILSTRENGLATELFPVLTDFNYVIAKLNIGDKVYLLDATDDYLHFGMIPMRCLNGKGRVLGEKGSYWYDLKATDKLKRTTMLNLKLESDGYARGTIQKTYFGYEASSVRKELASFQTEQEYIDDLNSKSKNIHIQKFELQNVEDLEKPLVVKLDVEIEVFDDMKNKLFLFNPFILNKIDENPFKSNERLYPVDYGAPVDHVTILNLEYPADFVIESLPEKVAMSLPNTGGRYIFDMQNLGNKLTMSNSMQISKPVFSSGEYHYLKELYNRIIQVQNADLVFKRK